MDRREAAKLAMGMDLSQATTHRIVDLVDTNPETYVQIEPIEDLVTTVWEKDEQFSKMKMHTVFTRRKGLHWFRCFYKKEGRVVERTPWTLVVESLTSAAGPKYGCALGMTEYRDVVVTEEERAANRELIKKAAIKAMMDQGIW